MTTKYLHFQHLKNPVNPFLFAGLNIYGFKFQLILLQHTPKILHIIRTSQTIKQIIEFHIGKKNSLWVCVLIFWIFVLTTDMPNKKNAKIKCFTVVKLLVSNFTEKF